MKSIAEIFDNSKELLDSISNFIDKYIGSSLLRKCGITKVIDSVTEKPAFEYADNPLSRLIGTVKESKFLEKCVSATQLLTDRSLSGLRPQAHTGCSRPEIFSATTKRIRSTALT